MQEMSEIGGKDALRIKQIAKRFDNVFSNAFKDVLSRMVIYTKPNEDTIIHLLALASDKDGNFVKFIGQYQVNDEELYCNKLMAKSFKSNKERDKAVNAFLDFIESMTQMNFPINKILLDLGVVSYRVVKIGKSKEEQGSVDVHICSYSDQAKDAYGFTDARRLVGSELVNF
mgnify:CR=1 FL=1